MVTETVKLMHDAGTQLGPAGQSPSHLEHAWLCHCYSDHAVLIFTNWVLCVCAQSMDLKSWLERSDTSHFPRPSSRQHMGPMRPPPPQLPQLWPSAVRLLVSCVPLLTCLLLQPGQPRFEQSCLRWTAMSIPKLVRIYLLCGGVMCCSFQPVAGHWHA